MNTRSIILRSGRIIAIIFALLTCSAVSAAKPFPPFGAGLAPAGYDDKCTAQDLERPQEGPAAFRIIPDQKYALCFPGRCWYFNEVLYCACEKLPENAPPYNVGNKDDWDDSISLTLTIRNNVLYDDSFDEFLVDEDRPNVCNVMENGNKEGYRVSTFSQSPAKPIFGGSDGAVYYCPGDGPGSYAQCDGGLCFEGVSEMTGARKLFKKQIMCSCPIVEPPKVDQDPPEKRDDYNAYGPFHPDIKDPAKRCSAEDCKAVCGAGAAPVEGPLDHVLNGTGPDIPIGAPKNAGIYLSCTLNEFQNKPPIESVQNCYCEYEGDNKWSARSETQDYPCYPFPLPPF